MPKLPFFCAMEDQVSRDIFDEVELCDHSYSLIRAIHALVKRSST